MVPKTLKDVETIAFEAHFDPAKYVTAPVNSNELITITFPAGDSIAFYGYLQTFEVGDATEGELISCTGTIMVTNTNAGTETGPDYTP